MYRIIKILNSEDDNDIYLYILGKPVIVNESSWIQNYNQIEKNVFITVNKNNVFAMYQVNHIIVNNVLIVD